MRDCRVAIVQKVEGEKLFLKYTRVSACADCHSKELCSFETSEEEFSLSYDPQKATFQVGEEVELSLAGGQKRKAIFLAYLLPLVGFFLLAGILAFFQVRELILAVSLLVFVCFYYCILYFFRRSIKILLAPQIRKVQ